MHRASVLGCIFGSVMIISVPVSAQTVRSSNAMVPDHLSELKVSEVAPGVHAYALSEAVRIKGAAECATASTIRLKAKRNGVNRPADPSLILIAQKTGQTVVLADAKCSSGSEVEGSAIGLEPEVAPVLDCTLPAPHGRPACGI